jgi:hypothetical protein|tara:strand:+ start:1432 stop:1632 length:201 start_codon:yes stop_codon:yes gene_type:complete
VRVQAVLILALRDVLPQLFHLRAERGRLALPSLLLALARVAQQQEPLLLLPHDRFAVLVRVARRRG